MTSTTQNSELQKHKKLYHKTIKIFGPPGTGKTWTLIERVVKKYIRKGVDPEKIAFISFTNKAVNTAIRRALEAFPHINDKQFKDHIQICDSNDFNHNSKWVFHPADKYDKKDKIESLKKHWRCCRGTDI